LNDVTVYIGGPISIENVIPEEIDNVEPGSRRSFIIEVYIPPDLAIGEYDLVLKAIAEHASDERYMKFIVLEKPPELERDLKRQIDELDKLLDDIWGEAVETGLEGKDVMDVFRSLKDAKDSIDKADIYWMNREYDKTRAEIGNAKGYIEKGVIGLAIARPEVVKEVKEVPFTKEITVYVLPFVYWVVISIFLIAIISLVYDRYKRAKPSKSLEERYELKRMRDRILGGRKTRASHLKRDAGHKPMKMYSDKAVLNMLKKKIKG
jgi:hypothetical protein